MRDSPSELACPGATMPYVTIIISPLKPGPVRDGSLDTYACPFALIEHSLGAGDCLAGNQQLLVAPEDYTAAVIMALSAGWCILRVCHTPYSNLVLVGRCIHGAPAFW